MFVPSLSPARRVSRRKLWLARLEAEEIQYLHFVELGDHILGRGAARSGRYQEFRDIYEAHLGSADARASPHKLLTTVTKATTGLLCFERDPATCHRSIVAKQLKDSGFDVFDLYADHPQCNIRNTQEGRAIILVKALPQPAVLTAHR